MQGDDGAEGRGSFRMSRELAGKRWEDRGTGEAAPSWRAEPARQADSAWPALDHAGSAPGSGQPAHSLRVASGWQGDREDLPEPTLPDSPPAALSSPGSCYLVVFEGGASRVVGLPEHGETSVGTSHEASLRVHSAGVMADHFRITTLANEAVLRVQPGNPPVTVNGEPLDDACVLASGDVIAVGDVMLGFHRGVAKVSVHPPLDAESFQRRLEEEIERALRYQNPLSVLVIESGGGSSSAPRAWTDTVCRAVRRVDIVGITGRTEVAVLFPETGQTAPIPARRVLEAVLSSAPDARGGMAICPEDGCNAEALLMGARAAARAAHPAQIATVSSAASAFVLGDRTIVAVDPVMKSLFALVRQLAASDLPVLLHGETGVGKEIVAQALHAWSARRAARIVAINCAALPETLLESELFGHERGAFSGAVSAKPGLFERASGGTVFLDEVGECSPMTQAKLLRVLETHKVSRVGGLEERPVNVRIVSATNRSLDDEIAAGRFRRDLYYRLNAASVLVPPLRDRKLDIPVLARRFLKDACDHLGRDPISITPAAMQRLSMHTWPGNVRELKNLMDFLAASMTGSELDAAQLPEHVAASVAPWMLARKTQERQAVTTVQPQGFRSIYEEIAELERQRMHEALLACGGARARAAELIRMPLRTFVTKLKLYGLSSVPSPRSARRPTPDQQEDSRPSR